MRGKQYSPFFKGFLKGCQYAGISAYRVSKEFGIPKSTFCRFYSELKSIKINDYLYKTKKQKPRSKNFKLLTEREVRELLREVRRNPRVSLKQLGAQLILGRKIGRTVLQKTLQEHHYKSVRPSVKQKSDKNYKKCRKLWAKTP